MKITFTKRPLGEGPERLECEAEITFGPGPLDGMKLVGLSLWNSPEGELYVTFPSRSFGAGADRRYFDYLRSANGDGPTASRRVKEWVVAEYKAATP